MVTDQVFLGTEETACDEKFIKQNFVSHILNTHQSIPNIYDPLNLMEYAVKRKLDDTK